jgi:hypothetical protein
MFRQRLSFETCHCSIILHTIVMVSILLYYTRTHIGGSVELFFVDNHHILLLDIEDGLKNALDI